MPWSTSRPTSSMSPTLNMREAVQHKFTEYLRRAEEIRAVLDEGQPSHTYFRPVEKPGGSGTGLNSAIKRENPNVKWSDVAGLERAKQAFQEAVILPLKFPQFFTGKQQQQRTFLLYGPSGTGKSYLAKAVATEANFTFFSASSSNLVSKWKSESAKLVSSLFQTARENAPSIIFIDEIDTLYGEGNDNEASTKTKTELLVQMQDIGYNDQKILVIATTNAPFALDQPIRRRFEAYIHPATRLEGSPTHVHLGDTPYNLTESDFEYLASRTEGFSGSDISICVEDVLLEPIRKTQDAMFFYENPEGMWTLCEPEQQGAVQTTMQELASKGLSSKILPTPVTRTDFEKILARKKPTVSKADLKVYERFTKEYGEEG
ncbi:hypothetical protein HN51_043076 [Arachis hypogaea]